MKNRVNRPYNNRIKLDFHSTDNAGSLRVKISIPRLPFALVFLPRWRTSAFLLAINICVENVEPRLPKTSFTPVSYTHLDVYKRQLLSNEMSKNC